MGFEIKDKTAIRLILASLMLSSACACTAKIESSSSNENECTIIGDIKNLKNGKLNIQDELKDFKKIAFGRAKNGKFVIKVNVLSPTYVYLYSNRYGQLRDFFLEPGVISISGNMEEDCFRGATGTENNNCWQEFKDEIKKFGNEQLDSLSDYYIKKAPSDLFKLKMVEYIDVWETEKKLEILQSLDSCLQSQPKVQAMKELFIQRSGLDFYIDVIQPDAEGNNISLKDIIEKKGNRYVLLDFWATWCNGCWNEIPYLKQAYEEYHDKGFDIYACSLDCGESIKRWIKITNENGLVWTNVCDGESVSSKAYIDYAIQGIPDNILIDCSNGRIIARSLHGEKMMRFLSKTLDGSDEHF